MVKNNPHFLNSHPWLPKCTKIKNTPIPSHSPQIHALRNGLRKAQHSQTSAHLHAPPHLGHLHRPPPPPPPTISTSLFFQFSSSSSVSFIFILSHKSILILFFSMCRYIVELGKKDFLGEKFHNIFFLSLDEFSLHEFKSIYFTKAYFFFCRYIFKLKKKIFRW